MSHNIALWDVIGECDIKGASDLSIRNAMPNDFSTITKVTMIKQVFTTGKTANAYYKKFTGEDALLLPSPSPANCAVSFEKLVENYKVILKYLY